jgi:hypothetical protein
MVKRSLLLLVCIACAVACSSSADDGGDSSGDQLNGDTLGPSVHAGGPTEVWSVQHQWTDQAPGGGTYEEGYRAWVSSFQKTSTTLDSWGTYDTVLVTTPYGKSLNIPTLECGETAHTLRILYASYHHLPYFEGTWSAAQHASVYAGHFGFVDKNGNPFPGFPQLNDGSYEDDEPSFQQGGAWPSDARLRGRHLENGSDDLNPNIGPNAGAGAAFDELLLNKRVGYFLLQFLVNYNSASLADPANLIQIKPEAILAGDVLLERTDRDGIGHTVPLFRVDTVNGAPAPSVATGYMPRRQAKWEDAIDARQYFVDPSMGGPDLGKFNGGIHRFRLAVQRDGRWYNTVGPADQDAYIPGNDIQAIEARPATFDHILAYGTPEAIKTAALQTIDELRQQLRAVPGSCSARSRRENAFNRLYDAEQQLENKDKAAVDKEFRKLEDYVFAELEYKKAKTCCWDSTTSQMAEIILDQANAEQQAAQAAGQCKAPTVFHAFGGGDGYDLWRQHARQMGRDGDWKPWHQDENPCDGMSLSEDALADRGVAQMCQ